jgi:hypothetical protein
LIASLGNNYKPTLVCGRVHVGQHALAQTNLTILGGLLLWDSLALAADRVPVSDQ